MTLWQIIFAMIGEAVWLAIIAAVVTLSSAASTLLMGIMTYRLKKMEILQVRQSEATEEIHKATNSMKDALVKKTEEASFAEGRESERNKQKE